MNCMQRPPMSIGVGAAGRVFEAPGDVFTGTGQGQAFEGGFVTQGDDVVEGLVGDLLDGLAEQAVAGDAAALQCGKRSRVHLSWSRARAEGVEVLGVEVAQQGFGHLRTRRVGHAEKQDALFLAHRGVCQGEGGLNILFYIYSILHIFA